MKNRYLICLLLITSGAINAQTNTFPATGNVGIGTTSPTDILTVAGQIKSGAILMTGWSNSPYSNSTWLRGANGVGVFLTNENVSRWAGIQADGSFDVSSGKLFVNATTGYVGLGTKTPAHQLFVNTGSKTNSLYVGAGSDFSDRSGNGDNIYIRQPLQTAGGWWGMNVAIQGPLAGHTAPFYPVRYLSDENSDGLDDTEHFFIDKYGGGFFRGKVGIGELNPTLKLEIYEPNPGSKITTLKRGIQGYEPQLPTTYGKPYLSIGSTEYKPNSIQSIAFGYTTGGSHQPAEIGFQTTDVSSYTLGDIVFANRHNINDQAPTEVMRLTSTGNLGLGTTSPLSKLVINENDPTKKIFVIQRGIQGFEAGMSTSFGKPYLSIGSSEFKPNSIQSIAFGYTTSGSLQPAEIGFRTTDVSAYTLGDIVFANRSNVNNEEPSEVVRITSQGNMGIGTNIPTEKLSVNGNVRAKKIIVSQTGWPDYVFDSSYKLKSLIEVEQFIKTNKRLPEIPSAKQVAEEGISVGDNQTLLLKKIEELTLYLIELKKENTDLKKRMDKLENK